MRTRTLSTRATARAALAFDSDTCSDSNDTDLCGEAGVECRLQAVAKRGGAHQHHKHNAQREEDRSGFFNKAPLRHSQMRFWIYGHTSFVAVAV